MGSNVARHELLSLLTSTVQETPVQELVKEEDSDHLLRKC